MNQAKILLLLLFLALSWAVPADAYVRGEGVLMYRPGEGYISHSREPYKHWPRSYLVRPEDLVYDELGNFVTEGIEVFRLRESRTLDPAPGSVIDKSRYFKDYLSRLAIASARQCSAPLQN